METFRNIENAGNTFVYLGKGSTAGRNSMKALNTSEDFGASDVNFSDDDYNQVFFRLP
jgi:hypothetical protein